MTPNISPNLEPKNLGRQEYRLLRGTNGTWENLEYFDESRMVRLEKESCRFERKPSVRIEKLNGSSFMLSIFNSTALAYNSTYGPTPGEYTRLDSFISVHPKYRDDNMTLF